MALEENLKQSARMNPVETPKEQYGFTVTVLEDTHKTTLQRRKDFLPELKLFKNVAFL